MCGLVFSYNAGPDESEQKNRACEALRRIAHRGPDAQGIIQKPFVTIGHCRLSIIDLAASAQPMADPMNRYTLSYNGEIYNYKEIRKELEKKWKFMTQGDTEVLLAGLAVYGSRFLQKLEGMWAFAFWDEQEKSLLIGRDRLGKKPLYYEATKDSFYCASELPALACLVDSSWSEDIDSTADYLRYGFCLPGYTAYKNVYEVLPGHTLNWSSGECPKLDPYWSLPIGSYAGTRQQAQRELDEKLTASIRKRLVADVEVGAFLSGGIDSSLVVSIMSKRLETTPKTFTIGFPDNDYDERSYARLVANECETLHYEECLRNWSVSELNSLVLNNVGQPFADSSLLPTALISKLASEHVKVVLSGDGADELFSGYQRYQARVLMRWYSRLPYFLRNSTERFVRLFPEPMSHHSRSLLKKAHLFQNILERSDVNQPYIAPLMYSERGLSELAPDLIGKGHKTHGLPEETHMDDIQSMMAADAIVYLPQDILTKVDRAAMAYSLEVRAPFLDSEVIKLAYSLPAHWHRRSFKGKCMLRETFKEFLPKRIWSRRKQGFAVPLHAWFRKKLGLELETLLEQSHIPLNKKFVRTLLSEHRQCSRDHGHRLWGIYIYLLCQQQKNQPGF